MRHAHVNASRLRRDLTRLSTAFLLALLTAFFPLQARDLGDMLNDVANSMSAAVFSESFDLDGIASSMSGNQPSAASGRSFDFDRIANSMTGAPSSEFAGVAEAMSITGTLDFVSNAFSGSSNNYLTTYGPGRTGQGHSAMLPAGSLLPISGVITSRFGWRPRFNRMHKGVDIALHIGDTVRAAVSGRVARVDTDPKGYGLFVVLKHENGLETRYAHLSQTLVWTGQMIAAGEPLALGGNTGNSTGPHLHFETRVNGTAVDPTTMFDFTRPGGAVEDNGIYSGGHYSGNRTWLASSSTKAPKQSTDRSTYVVKIGDTVQSVARTAGISVLTLCRLNMLSTYEALEPGRMLRLR